MAKPNPSTTRQALVFAGGLIVGGGVGYAIASSRAEKKTKDDAAPPQIPPKPPGGPAITPGGSAFTPGSYRKPETMSVDLPNTTAKRDHLDEVICDVFLAISNQNPTTDDVTLGVLQQLVPDVQWPAITGDHWSLISLQAMVGMRVQQIATDSDPNKTSVQNLYDFCPKQAQFDQ